MRLAMAFLEIESERPEQGVSEIEARELQRFIEDQMERTYRTLTSRLPEGGYNLKPNDLEYKLEIPGLPQSHNEILSQQCRNIILWTAILEQFDQPAPAVVLEVGKKVPVDAIGSVPDAGRLEVAETISILNSLAGQHHIKRTEMKISEARRVVADGITDSAISGINIVRDEKTYDGDIMSNYRTGVVPGLEVTVHTHGNGLALLYSSANFVKYNLRFGGTLSTPVKSFIEPGRYIFGAELLDGPKMEMTEHMIPPNLMIYLATI